jgi:hypothetical protein
VINGAAEHIKKSQKRTIRYFRNKKVGSLQIEEANPNI